MSITLVSDTIPNGDSMTILTGELDTDKVGSGIQCGHRPQPRTTSLHTPLPKPNDCNC